ncbi:LytR/AlgR family response regulator transcription factor [Niabella beijingensis]|uniref:LytR/AlgR family response regulator transcription factor n=1 Tax=Niabella beijingensis TaxID=2872700 RepID=UPI001CBCC951|nr:LytTR family DNA-binding domain-containing protein [Niabella beijingensis]MBZ4189224.1 LytTR family DNA-binding domain-containing protein [Niabella beijingensis]
MNAKGPLICLLVDDNKVARVILRKILRNVNAVEVVGECESALEAKSFLEFNHVDVLFLDVEMPEMNGLELLKLLPNRPHTILTTAKEQYAVEAFELNVVDYLVKPFTLTRVLAAIDKVQELIRFKQSQQADAITPKHLFIKENKVIRKINVEDILWMEAKGDYVQFNLPDKTYMVHGSLKTIEDKFSTDKFVRVHRSYVIAIDKVEYIENRLVYIKNQPIPVSESYKDALLAKLHLL